MIRTKLGCYKFSKYQKAHEQSIRNPKEFWGAQVNSLTWFKKPKQVLDDSQLPFCRWFPDGQLNVSYNALDRHLEYNKDQIAIHYCSPVTNTERDITYQELYQMVSRLASGLKKSVNIQKGDRVIIYMPMVPEAVAAMLACTRIGAIHSVVFGGFAAPELGSRIKDAKAKAVITCTFGMDGSKKILYKPIVDQAIQLSGLNDVKTVVFQRSGHKVSHDFDLISLIENSEPVEATPVESNHPSYMIYTSGTTGTPKGIVRDTIGLAMSVDYMCDKVLDIHRNDVLFTGSDIGWVVGHCFSVYGPLIRGAASILYEGKPTGTPDCGIYWRLLESKKVKHFFTSPTALRVLRKEDPDGIHIKKANISHLKGLSFAGERCDIPTYKWVQQHFPNIFLNDNYWQTESGFTMVSNFLNLEQFKFKPGSATKPVPGFNIKIFDNEGQESPVGKLGKICVALPTPPGFMSTLWGNEQGYVDKYFKDIEGFYNTGDAGYKDEDGYLHIMTRIDDIINTAGHRLSTTQMEEVLMHHHSIAEAIVVGVKDEIKGEIPIGFVTIKDGITISEQDIKKFEAELIKQVREDIGPVASFKRCVLVQKLPKTRSGKYLRNILRAMANNEAYKVPPTIEDQSVLEPIEKIIKRLGLHTDIIFEEDIQK